MKKIIEWCSYCEQEVEIQAIKYKVQECPNCKKLIKACSLCDTNKCNCNKCKGGQNNV